MSKHLNFLRGIFSLILIYFCFSAYSAEGLSVENIAKSIDTPSVAGEVFDKLVDSFKQDKDFLVAFETMKDGLEQQFAEILERKDQETENTQFAVSFPNSETIYTVEKFLEKASTDKKWSYSLHAVFIKPLES
ncbi:MAG: hypothetical protein WCG04_03820 [Alphaproteobacteria bacterium]